MTVIDVRMAQMLKEDRPLLGMFIGIPNAALVEIASFAGFDFVIIDNEHGPAGIETTENLIRAARGVGIPPVVRVSGANVQEILRTLDAGASGVQVPQVNNADQMRLVVEAAKYPPLGNRGVAFSTRAAGYGSFGGAAHVQRSNEQTIVVTHVETVEAVKNLDSMLAVGGVNAVFIGPTDLSVSMGHAGNPGHPEVQETIAACIAKIRAAGVAAGVLVTSPEDFAKFAGLGALYLPCNGVGLVNGGFRAMVKGCKG